jgi:hypothetical protein
MGYSWRRRVVRDGTSLHVSLANCVALGKASQVSYRGWGLETTVVKSKTRNQKKIRNPKSESMTKLE